MKKVMHNALIICDNIKSICLYSTCKNIILDSTLLTVQKECIKKIIMENSIIQNVTLMNWGIRQKKKDNEKKGHSF